MKTLGKKIRLLRHQKGWSQEDVSKRLDISIPAFSKIETGITDVNLSRLEQIATLFEMTVVQLLTFNDTEQQEKYISEVAIVDSNDKNEKPLIYAKIAPPVKKTPDLDILLQLTIDF